MSATKFLAGFIVGGAIGAIAGVLLAPKSGEETRAMIADGAKEAMKRADETVKQIQSKADDVVSDMQKKGDEIKEKLQNLILELSKIYPCTLNIHILEDDYFVAYSLKKHKGKYLAYYRLKIGSILPQSITKCVYLDVDMLVLGDLRELFAIDLKGKICGVVMEYNSQKIFKPKDKTYKTLDITGSYFNSGMLLVDLYLWRKEGIEDKAFGFSKSYYYFLHDQDLLNLALYEKTYKIGMEWNFMVYVYYRAICADERGRRKLPYRRQEFNYSLKNIKIIHYFAYSKPWEDSKIYLDYHNKFLGQYWWDMVEQTPIFKEELLEKKPQADNALSFQCYLGYKLLRLYQKGLF